MWKQQIFSETFLIMARAWNVFSLFYQEYKQNIVFLKTSTLASSLKEIERLILELKELFQVILDVPVKAYMGCDELIKNANEKNRTQ